MDQESCRFKRGRVEATRLQETKMYTKNNVQDKPICHSSKPSQTYDQEIKIGINLNFLFLPIQKKIF